MKYIYIYIYSHPQTDSFVQSELFSVARHVAGIETHPTFTLDLVSERSANKRTTLAKGIIRYYVATAAAVSCLHSYTLSATRVLDYFEELCIMRAAAENSFARVLNPHEGAYILSSTDRLFRSIRTLQCSKTRRTLEAGIETRPTFTLDLVSDRSANKRTT